MIAYRQILVERGIIQSMSRKGCLDNVAFLWTIKNEMLLWSGILYARGDS